MKQDFIIEFDYFKNRNYILYLLNKIDKEFSNQKLTGYHVFINNIPTSLEFYAYFCFDINSEDEIEKMKEILFEIGIYRPDISLNLLFDRMGDRGFNSYAISPLTKGFILKNGFWYNKPSQLPTKEYFTEKHIQRLKMDGYNAFKKLTGGTTIFISHSSKQKQEMEKIIPYFNSVNELIWLDKFRLKQKDNKKIIKEQIAEGINQANKVLFYITRDFLESYWCIYELKLSKEICNKKKDYELLFVINADVENKFFSEYKDIVDYINQDNVVIVDIDTKLEDTIEKFISTKKFIM